MQSVQAPRDCIAYKLSVSAIPEKTLSFEDPSARWAICRHCDTDPNSPALPDSRRRYFPALDGLRFLAFLLIFSHHAIPQSLPGHPLLERIVHNTWCGVDLFFVLSGFLISYLLFVEEDKRKAQTGVATFSFRLFWVRRTLRIWPLYYLALFLGFIVLPRLSAIGIGPFIGTPEYAALGNGFSLSAPIFLMNWTSIQLGYPSSMMLAPLWSVCVEEQFYLLWPVTLLFLKRRYRTVFIVGFILVSHLLKIPFYYIADPFSFSHLWIYLNPILRADTLMTGALIAHFMITHEDRLPRFNWLAKIAACGVVGILGVLPGIASRDMHEMVVGYILLDIACAAGVILCLTSGSLMQRVFSIQPLPWLGRISYGLYVYHMLALSFGSRLTTSVLGNSTSSSSHVVRYAASLAICVAISAASYFLFERWFLRLKMKYTVVESRPGG